MASNEKHMLADQVDAYVNTINRLEPDIAMIDAGAAAASIAISLKRIADAQARQTELAEEMTRMAREQHQQAEGPGHFAGYGHG